MRRGVLIRGARAFALSLGLGLLAAGGLAQQQNAVEQAAAAADPAVGRVVVRKNEGGSTGSGLVLSRSKSGLLFLTNHHVIDGAVEIVVGFNQGGTVFAYKAQIVADSSRLDLAVLELKPVMDVSEHQVSALPVRIAIARKGEGVVALGFPATADYLGTTLDDPEFFISTVTSGSVSRITHGSWGENTASGDKFDIVQHTAAINPGNSGGPLIDLCAQLVGLNTLSATRTSAGSAANDTYWANSAPVIAAFLDHAQVPYQPAQDCGPAQLPRAVPLSMAQTPTWMIALFGLIVTLAVIGGIVAVSQLRLRRDSLEALRHTSLAGTGAPAGAPALALEFGSGLRHTLDREALLRGQTIGRGEDADLRIEGAGVSRVHARLRLEGRRLMLTDLGSTNGTRVDGKALAAQQPVAVSSGSRITLGSETLALRQVRGGG